MLLERVSVGAVKCIARTAPRKMASRTDTQWILLTALIVGTVYAAQFDGDADPQFSGLSLSSMSVLPVRNKQHNINYYSLSLGYFQR